MLGDFLDNPVGLSAIEKTFQGVYEYHMGHLKREALGDKNAGVMVGHAAKAQAAEDALPALKKAVREKQ
jgi:hypothetical protein